MTHMMVSRKAVRGAHNGVDLVFEPGVPRPVRTSLIAYARSLGALPIEDAGEIEIPQPIQSEPKTGLDTHTQEKIRAAIQEILESNERNTVSVNGIPKVRAIEKLIGQQITTADRDLVWESMIYGG